MHTFNVMQSKLIGAGHAHRLNADRRLEAYVSR